MSKAESIFSTYEELLKGAGRIKDENLHKKAKALSKSLSFFKNKPAQSSIHFNSTKTKGARKNPPKINLSYAHNTRELDTDSRIKMAEITQELSKLQSPTYAIDTPENNEYYGVSLQDLRIFESRAREDYFKAHSQRMQKKAQVIKESIVNLNANHTMQDVKALTQALYKEFGLKTLHIAIHRDEGHFNKLTGEKQYNYHAHIMFANYDFKTHRSVFRKFTKKDLSRMQDLNAQILGMQRGKKNSRTHINRYQIDYKAKKELENIKTLATEIKQDLQRYKSKEFNAKEALKVFLESSPHHQKKILENLTDTQAHAMNKILATTNKADLPLNKEPKMLLMLRSKWQLAEGREANLSPFEPLKKGKVKSKTRSKTMEKQDATQEQDTQIQEQQGQEEEVNQPSLPFDDSFIECKSPQEKDEHADKILKDFESHYKDIDKVIKMAQRQESKLPQEKPQAEQDKELTENKEQEGNSNELDRAINEITQARNVFEILSALYSIEKGMYELGIGEKPKIEDFTKKFNEMKDKALDSKFLTQSIKTLKEGKEKIQDFSKNIKLERALAKELSKDIKMHDLVSESSKSAYIRKIDKKLESALLQCPQLKNDYPKIIKQAESICKGKENEKHQNQGMQR
ncbi:hypothetical protein [Helicobacter typhlonius]|uniref:hypothetical protein n=1 Tax=Helicobacter typhlonius TaxID=76936 RepID=UPI002FE274E9